MSQSVQAAAYQVTLDRTVDEHKLPENCIVIAAGNRATNKAAAYIMPKALVNRLCYIEIGSGHKAGTSGRSRRGSTRSFSVSLTVT